eukprot:6212664-Pleurochrysis_carterae.AAC.1
MVNGRGAGAGAGAGRTYGAARGRGRSLGQGGHRERVPIRAWGAELERSASMHAMRLQNGKPCM